MASGIRQLFGIVCLAVLAQACDANRPIAPDSSQEPLAAAAASGLMAWSNTIDAVHLGWPDNSKSESGYEVHRSLTGESGTFTLRATLEVNSTGHSDTGLEPKTEHCYKVRSFRTTGQKRNYTTFSNTACATTWGEPPAPTEMYARPNTASSVATWWSDNSIVETGFRLETAATADGAWSLVATLAANRSSHVHEGLPLEQPLCYRVIAFNSVGDSPPSPVKCTALPARPTDLTATSADAQSIDVGWADNSAFEDGYELHRAQGNDGWSLTPWNLVATLPANATTYRDADLVTNTRYWYRVRAGKDGGTTAFSAEVSGVPIGAPPPPPSSSSAWASGTSVSVSWMSSGPSAEGYRVERSNDGVSGWILIATINSNQGTGVADSDRPLEQLVCYRVIAFNRLGESAPSSTICVTPLAAPVGFEARPAGNGAIDLTWTDVSRANTEYYVEILRTWYGGSYGYYEWWEYLTTVGGDATSHRVTGLDSFTLHRFRLLARSSGSVSDPSNEASSWTETPPAAPSNLSATAISSGRIDLTWNDNASDETHFDVERCQGTANDCGDWGFVAVASVAANTISYNDTAVTPGTTYTYRVLAYNGAPSSDPTNTVTAATPPAPEE